MSSTEQRYWQNWDNGEAAKRIDGYWLAEEGAYRSALIADICGFFGRRVPLLEVGCGTGLIYGEMLRQGVVKPKTYIGGDVSRKMLEIAGARFPSAQFRELDIFGLPFADRSQPNVMCIHVLQHLPTYEQALRELLRVTQHKLYLASWFVTGAADEIVFSEKSDQWDGQSFHNNSYALGKFLSHLADRDISDLRIRHAGGRNYLISVAFGQKDGLGPPSLLGRAGRAWRTMTARWR